MMKKIYLTALLLIFTLLISTNLVEARVFRPLKVDEKTKVFRDGQVRYEKGIYYLELSGDYFEMGFQYGVLMKEELKGIVNQLYDFKGKMIRTFPWYLEEVASTYTDMEIELMERRIPEDYRHELQGMAYGAGLPYYKLLAAALAPQWLTPGCSAIIKRVDDRVMLARNLDYSPGFLGKYPVVVEYNPNDKNKFTSIGIIGFPGVLTGYNKQGLALSVNVAKLANDEDYLSTPIGYLNREILENCSDLEQVDNKLNGFKSDLGWIISIVSNKDNDGAIYDLAGSTVQKTSLADKKDLYITNFFLNKDLRREKMGIVQVGGIHNQGRYQNLRSEVENTHVKGVGDLIDILSSTTFYEYQEDIQHGLILHGTVNNEGTIQSIVLDPARKEVYFSWAEGYAGFGPYYQIDTRSKVVTKYPDKYPQIRERAKRLYQYQQQLMDDFLFGNTEQVIKTIYTDDTEISYLEMALLLSIWEEDHSRLETEQLLADLEQVLERYDNLDLLLKYRGQLLLAMGKDEEAISTLKSALQVEHTFPGYQVEIYAQLAEIYNQRGQRSMAKEYAKRCIHLIKEYQVGDEEDELINRIDKFIR